MSDDLQSLVAGLQLTNYISIATTTAIVYDYFITLPKEIRYVWDRPWTRVSTLFVVVRYIGLFVVVIEALSGSTFIPGPTSVCTVLVIASSWAFVPFLAAADWVMILRVQAMYRGSRIVLGVLVLFYVPTMILVVIATGFYYDPNHHMSVSTPRVLDASYCNVTYTFIPGFGLYVSIPRFILAGLMFILSLVRFFMDSFQMYRTTRQWLPSRYINLLVRESIIYFSAHLLYTTNSAVIIFESNIVLVLIVSMLSNVSLFTLCPRFIISVRELYVRDSQRHWRWESEIDTGFGVSGQSRATETVERPREMQVMVVTTEFREN
ncbi:hypothetical protein OG21DRAFT_1070684 [Imleria badia]|nr:hypothetical protein OG21DRAFT_1070684 [Imleria badia]